MLLRSLLCALLFLCTNIIYPQEIVIFKSKGENFALYAEKNKNIKIISNVTVDGINVPVSNISIITVPSIPTPPVPPDDSSLKSYTKLLASQIPGTTVKQEISLVQANLIRIVNEIGQLKDPSKTNLTVLTTRDASEVLNGLNEKSLGNRYQIWKPYLEKMATKLELDTKDGKIKKNVFGMGDAYKEIASGLESFSFNKAEFDAAFKSLPKDLSKYSFEVATPEAETPEYTESELQKIYKYNKGGDVNFEDQGVFPPVHLDQVGQPDNIRRTAAEGGRVFKKYTKEKSNFLSILPKEFRGQGKGKRACYWNYALRLDGKDGLPSGTRFGVSQITGNCVAASFGDVVVTHLIGVSYYLLEKPINPFQVGSTSWYMWRGHCGQGANLGTIGAAYTKYGIPIRKQYLDKYDLRDTNTDQKFGMNNCRSQPDDFVNAVKSETRFGQVSEFNGTVDDAIDILFVGGALWCGGTTTWGSNGNPICSRAGVGPHAQACIGYDDTDEMKKELKTNETIFFFDQTWGGSPTSYIKSGWRSDWWGNATKGMGCLTWSGSRGLLHSATTYAILPDLSGVEPEDINWRNKVYSEKPSNN
jgi:hypothetical protein